MNNDAKMRLGRVEKAILQFGLRRQRSESGLFSRSGALQAYYREKKDIKFQRRNVRKFLPLRTYNSLQATVSRALMRLDALGLIEVVRGKGYRAVKVSSGQLVPEWDPNWSLSRRQRDRFDHWRQTSGFRKHDPDPELTRQWFGLTAAEVDCLARALTTGRTECSSRPVLRLWQMAERSIDARFKLHYLFVRWFWQLESENLILHNWSNQYRVCYRITDLGKTHVRGCG
jgi:hypothetical protein